MQIPSAIHTGFYKREKLHVTHSECNSSQTLHHIQVARANTFINKSEVITVPADMKRNWKAIHDSLFTDISCDLFSADLISSNTDKQCDETIPMNTNDNFYV